MTMSVSKVDAKTQTVPTLGETIYQRAKDTVKNVKVFCQNNTSFGRMKTFNESFGTAWVNAGKNTYAEAKALFMNTPAESSLLEISRKIAEDIKGKEIEKPKTVPVQSSVPRLEYYN